jgi:hypothetical protein
MMGKALNLECGGWIRADYDEPGQVYSVLTVEVEGRGQSIAAGAG